MRATITAKDAGSLLEASNRIAVETSRHLIAQIDKIGMANHMNLLILAQR